MHCREFRNADVALEDFPVFVDEEGGRRQFHIAKGTRDLSIGIQRNLERQLSRLGVVEDIVGLLRDGYVVL